MSTQPKKDTIQMGERIRQEREQRGWSQEQLLAQMNELLALATETEPYYGARGYSDVSGLSRIESGANGATRRNFALIAAALGVTPESLYVEKSMVAESHYLQDLPYVELEHIPFPARASFASMCGTESDYGPTDTLRLYLSSSTHRMNYDKMKVITSSGDSMEGVINDGDRVIISLIPEGNWEYITNCVVVVSYGDVVTIKGVQENDLFDKQFLTLYPSRKDMAPLRVRRADIQCIWRVVEFFDRPKVTFKRI